MWEAPSECSAYECGFGRARPFGRGVCSGWCDGRGDRASADSLLGDEIRSQLPLKRVWMLADDGE